LAPVIRHIGRSSVIFSMLLQMLLQT
jgi:hypothetical protein